MEALLVVFGALVGALATGGVTAWDSWRIRRIQRRVAARLILGDLYVAEAVVEVVLKYQRWPDRLDLETPLQTWRESRERFAEGVEAWEWALVDGVFSNLHRTGLMVRLGQPCTANDKAVLTNFGAAIPRARDIVVRHATSEKERARLV